jgi:hypothetical protein
MPGNARHFLFYQHLFKTNRINIFEIQKAQLKIDNFSYMARILVLLVLIVSSCTIQKRHFTKGYDVHWKGYYASNSNDYSEATSEDPEPCDTIQNKDGSLTLAIVERIDSKKIYVTPCDNSTFRENSIDRAVVHTIRYANGALFENKTPEQLQKDREENLEKYRLEQPEREKELEIQRIAAENEKLRRQNDSLQRVNSELKNNTDNYNTEEELINESDRKYLPLMKVFFIIGFVIAGLTLILTAADLASDIAIGFLGVLFITDIVSIFITIASLVKMNRNKGKYKGKPLLPLLLEFLFGVVSLLAALYWIFMAF